MDEVDQVTLTDAQKIAILTFFEKEYEATLHRSPIKVESGILKDLTQLLESQLVFPLILALHLVEQFGFHLCFLELLSYDKLHLLLFICAEIDYLALHLLDDKEHYFHCLGLSLLVNEDTARICIGLII